MSRQRYNPETWDLNNKEKYIVSIVASSSASWIVKQFNCLGDKFQRRRCNFASCKVSEERVYAIATDLAEDIICYIQNRRRGKKGEKKNEITDANGFRVLNYGNGFFSAFVVHSSRQVHILRSRQNANFGKLKMESLRKITDEKIIYILNYTERLICT